MLETNKNVNLQGRVSIKQFPTGGKVHENLSGFELVKFQYRQYSLDERSIFIIIY